MGDIVDINFGTKMLYSTSVKYVKIITETLSKNDADGRCGHMGLR